MVDAREHAPQKNNATANEVHIYKTTIRKLYTDDVVASQSNQELGKTTL